VTLGSLEMRIALLEDIEAVRKVQARFLYLIDEEDWQGVANMFTESAILDLGPSGSYRGKEEIAKFYRDLPKSVPLQVHMSHNPIVEIKGDNATGEWYFEVPATDAVANKAMWIVGKFEVDFMRVDGEWKIQRWLAKCIYKTPYDEGWVKNNLCA
jgi:ketosteroid isomerase-like protein